jgi:hypothetical protein
MSSQALCHDFTKRRLNSVATTKPPTIDGRIDDEAWNGASKAEQFFDRVKGGSSGETTVAWVTYDDKAIYVAFECLDSKAHTITARETERDSRWRSGDELSEDHVDVRFDFFLTRKFETYVMFSVNALGTPSVQFNSGRGRKAEWQGSWDAKSQRTEKGWTAEMRIPWEILDYPESAKGIDVGINFTRYVTRLNEQSIWSQEGPEWKNQDGGIWEKVQPPPKPNPKISLLPYALATTSKVGSSLRFGLDARYPMTSTMTVVGSIFPDFSTVEGAVEGINFARSERFLPERRPFFLEGEEFFSLGSYYRIGRFFYTRRIESFDAGIKAYGHLGKNQLGILATYDTNGVNPDRSSIVGKFTHNVNDSDSVSAFVNSRQSVGSRNTVAAVEGVKRNGKLQTELLLATSQDQTLGGANSGNLAARYFDGAWYHYLHYAHVGENYRNDLGLTDFTGYKGWYWYDYYFQQPKEGSIREYSFVTEGSWDSKLDGSPFRRGGFASASVTLRNDMQFGLGYNYATFEKELEHYRWMNLVLGSSNRFRRFGITYTQGSIADDPYRSLSAFGSFRLGKRFDLSVSSDLVRLGDNRTQHVLTGNYQIGPGESLGGRVVFQDGDTGAFLSYRRSGGSGTEYYLVVGDPRTTSFSRQIQFKVVFSR